MADRRWRLQVAEIGQRVCFVGWSCCNGYSIVDWFSENSYLPRLPVHTGLNVVITVWRLHLAGLYFRANFANLEAFAK